MAQTSGVDKYKNIANKTFPTIAPVMNIDNLVEVDGFINDILFVAKNYYKQVASEMVDATLKMLDMYDLHNVPHEDWRQTHVTFNGYSTYYEYADNKSETSLVPNKRFDFDGPWSYSVLQRYLYEYAFNNGDVRDFSFVFRDVDSQLASSISGSIVDYMRSSSSIYMKQNILKHSIAKSEHDSDLNYFTLVKKDDSTHGVVLFRFNEVPLSIPLAPTFVSNFSRSSDSVTEIISALSLKCVDFGIVDRNVMWMLGYERVSGSSVELLRLCTFKFEARDCFVMIDSSSFKTYSSTSYSDYLYNLNDFIGVSMHDDELLVLTYNCNEELAKLKSTDENPEKLMNGDVSLYVHSLDLLSNNVKTSKITVNNSITPMFLDHSEGKRDHIRMYKNRIWQVERYKDTCNICYEALNPSLCREGDFNYYMKYDTSTYKIEVMEIVFNENSYKVYDSSVARDGSMQFSNEVQFIQEDENGEKMYESIVVDNEASRSMILVDSVVKLLKKYPRCISKNGKFVVQMIPFGFYKECSGNVIRYVADKLVNSRRPASKFNDNVVSFSEFIDIASYFRDLQDLNAMREEIRMLEECVNLNYSTVKYLNGVMSSGRTTIEDATFSSTADLFEKLPFIKNCMLEKMMIVCYFKNETGITFINDYALDLDLTCYIDDDFERSKKVGYGNGYTETKYIKWMGDTTKGGFEALYIDVRKYIKERLENREINTDMKIALNLCWNENSEITEDNVYVSINWNMIKEDIPMKLIRVSKKDCKNRVLSISVNMLTEVLTYDIPKLYPVVKVAYKDKIVGYEDGVPDIQVGFMNLTEKEFDELPSRGWAPHYGSPDEDGVEKVNMLSRVHPDERFKNIEKKIDFASFVLNAPMSEEFFYKQVEYIRAVLGTLFAIQSNRLNYVTKQRLGFTTFSKLCLADIYFGDDVKNVDSSTGVNMIYYAYLNPTYFREYAGMYDYEIDACVLIYRMTHEHGFIETSYSEDAALMKSYAFAIVPHTQETLADFDEYALKHQRTACSVDGFFEYVITKYSTPETRDKKEMYLELYRSWKVSNEEVEALKTRIADAILEKIGGTRLPEDLQDVLDSYSKTELRHKQTPRGFFNYMQELAYDVYCKYGLQDVYFNLDD